MTKAETIGTIEIVVDLLAEKMIKSIKIAVKNLARLHCREESLGVEEMSATHFLYIRTSP